MNRSHLVTVRLTPDEAVTLTTLARTKGLTLSAYVRQRLFRRVKLTPLPRASLEADIRSFVNAEPPAP